MISVERYRPEMSRRWNEFVLGSRNATFLHHRSYLEYHGDRFPDHSLCFFEGSRLVGVLPATFDEEKGVASSHSGLTYGGLLVGERTRALEVAEMMEKTVRYFTELGAKLLVYKPVPHIFHRQPSEEDLYALWRLGARLQRRDLSSAVYLPDPGRYTKGRKWSVKRAVREGVEVEVSGDWDRYWEMLSSRLMEKHGVTPTHTLGEIRTLAQRFPDHIELLVGLLEGKMLAGAVLYKTTTVVHTQYMATTEEGRSLGALDLVIHEALGRAHAEGKRWFSFGISTSDGGRILDDGLVAQKEGFGARAVTHDCYELALA